MNLSSSSRLTLATTLAALLFTGGWLNSQTPIRDDPSKSPAQRLADVKAANTALLEKQKASLERLAALQKEAEQLRIFTKRN